MSVLKSAIAVFDGSFEGLLTSIFDCYTYELENIYTEENLQKNFLNDYIYISTDIEKSKRVKKSIKEKLSNEVYSNIKTAYKSSHENIFIWIYRYIKFAYKVGTKVDLYIHYEAVHKVISACKFYNNEVHMLEGVTRFSKTKDGVLYAKIEPKNDLIEDLASFFHQRLGNENWIIHDIKRELIAVFNQKQIIITSFPKDVKIKLSEDEEIYRELWYQFVHSISIEERRKTKLQTQLLAKRYQKNLNEFNDIKSKEISIKLKKNN